VHDPKFRAVIFRRTYPQITVAGGLWDESMEWYPLMGGRPLKGEMSWRFPSGAVISFRHLEHEATKYDWQGSQVPYFGFDELTHFTESIFTYIAYSRGRTNCTVQPHVRATCNPDPGWVKKFLAPWVDSEFDGPRAESAEVRWFIQDGDKRRWVDADYPDAKSLTFVRASIYDNRIGLEKNPRYLPNLKALPPIERARLLDGNWDVRQEGLVYYRPEHGIDFQECIVDQLPAHLEGQPVGGIDFGFRNPFAGLSGFLDHDDVLWITFVRYKSWCTLPVHSEALPKGVRWWCDPARPDERVELRLAGHDVIPCVHIATTGSAGEKKTPKQSGIDVVADRIRTGRLKIHREACLPLIRELGLYHYDPDKSTEEPVDEDNHACDALRYLCVGITRGHAVPSVVNAAEVQAEQLAREQAERDKELAERKERDRLAQADIDLDHWWTQ
jgi:hypothetical protein